MDKDFIRRLKRRDEKAFDRLVMENQDLIIGYLTRMLGDREQALDLAQDVFLAAFRFIDGFRGDGSIRTWLLQISKNLLKNHYRWRDRRMQAGHSSLEEYHEASARGGSGVSPEDEYTGQQSSRILQEALTSLPEDFRECLILRDLELMEYEEIARITGLCLGTVKSRIFRARSRLAVLLKEISQRGPGK